MVLGVNPNPKLHGHGNIGSLGCLDCGRNNVGEQATFIRQSAAASATGDLRNRTTKVHVDVISEVFFHDHLRGLVGPVRIRGVELKRARIFVRGEGRHVHCFFIALTQGACCDHFAHVQTGDTAHFLPFEFAAQCAESNIGHASHGGEDDWGVQAQRSDL